MPEEEQPISPNVPTEQVQNSSGTNNALPTGVAGWGWGPFFLTWTWGVFNGVWISLLMFVPFVNLIFAFVLGANGREWAWKAKHWDSVESFNKTQRKWSIAGVLLGGIPILFILFVIIIVVINPAGRL